ncbi:MULTISPECIES: S24 family peptidase [Burkholderia cepacia complex]|uniref:S24 family peptidase n=1 Tax=Burkholderia cepacia complex TaxID=87882 RepID=UPI0011B20A95|nr:MULTISPECIES: S24 family peptidase [Burkholderia cepacia complex]MBR8084607.1 hypothetical protein [Burkholderia vietnamiensis]
MNELELARARIAALKAAIDKLCDGNKSAFGRRLGYKDGAFVRQMLSGERPISEKTIRAIEGLAGMRGWFAAFTDSEAAATPKRIEHKTNIQDASSIGGKGSLLAESSAGPRSRMESNVEAGPSAGKRHPLISWAQASTWDSIVENFSPADAEEWLDSPVSVSEKSYYLRVRGESMYDPADHRSFREGELILVDPEVASEHGAFVLVVAAAETEPVLRQLLVEGDRHYFKALNPNWPNRIVEADGTQRILGVVKSKIVRY